MTDSDFTRRGAFALAGLGAAALTATGAAAAAKSEGEKANLKLVQDMCKTWKEPGFDADQVFGRYLAPDSSVRLVDSQPFLNGASAVAAAFKTYTPNGERFKVKFLETYAKGPIVVTHRIDTMFGGGKPEQNFEVVGVFLVKDGKIKEWTDYLLA